MREGRSISGRTALVTGASSGIGLELSRLLAADANDLVLVGRDGRRLDALAEELRAAHGKSMRCEVRDLSEPNAALELWTELARTGLAIDVLVNNAGVGLYGPVQEQHPEALARMVQLNVGSLTMLTRLALPGMQERGWGRILNVASIAAYQPAGPQMASYYATKAYVLSFSKGLARELAGSGVSATALCPGVTATSFEKRSGAEVSGLYKWLPKATAASVARAGYRGMKRRATVVLPGAITKVLAVAGELPPRRIALEVNRVLLRRT
jgi:short-subunit dehydrogenase